MMKNTNVHIRAKLIVIMTAKDNVFKRVAVLFNKNAKESRETQKPREYI